MILPFMLDTSTCVDISRGRLPGVVQRLKRHAAGSIGISTITLAELEYGVSQSKHRERDSVVLAHFLVPLKTLPFDQPAAIVYGQVRAALEAAGTPIGPLDTLIAAHALSIGATVVTSNDREFRRVPGLKVENWTR
jgi:tRNA(fMet)-specific endonuclease VapC